MTMITLHPGDQPPYYQPTYSIQTRHAKGYWSGEGRHMGIKDIQEALAAARKKLDYDKQLIVRVVDQRGKVYWTNEEATPPA